MMKKIAAKTKFLTKRYQKNLYSNNNVERVNGIDKDIRDNLKKEVLEILDKKDDSLFKKKT